MNAWVFELPLPDSAPVSGPVEKEIPKGSRAARAIYAGLENNMFVKSNVQLSG
jgi:hypothetical protein